MGNAKYKNTDIGMIPCEWEVSSFSNYATIERGGSPRPIEKYLTNSVNGVNWIKIGDVAPNDKYITKTKEKIIKEGIIHSREVKEGDFILSNSMSFGRPYILKIDGCIHDGWLVIKDFYDNFDKDFLYYLLSSDSIQNQYVGLVAGSGVKNLNKDIVKKVLVIKPNSKEQQKIATTLTHIDNLINDYEKLIKKKEAIKKGMMQELFNKDIVNVKMCDVFDIIKGKQINKSTLYKKGKYYVLNGGQQPSGYTDNYNTDKNVISISEGGNSCGFVSYNVNKFWAGGHLYVLYLKEKEYNIKYLFHILKYQESLIMNLRKGSGLPNIKKNDLKNFEIPLNYDVNEQKNIANVLDNISDGIDMANSNLNILKSLKKSMMSNLLTGKIRL